MINARTATAAAALATTVAAVALSPGQAVATPTPLSNKHARLTTDDGWKLALDATDLVVNPMHSLANAPTSREGWISSKVTGTITGAGTTPVNAGVLEHFLVVGCQIDVSDGATLGLSGAFGPNVGVTISGVPGATIGGSASISPSISAHIRPGKVTELTLGKKILTGEKASVRVQKAHVNVDGCYGRVSVRIIARLSASTTTADDTINVYSARTWL